ncbi:MAG: glycoside hydrolase family 57 protein [Phycisphaeraceae bacterium]
MPSVCFYFQMHQPFRLRRYSIFDTEPTYFDEAGNAEILKKVAERSYEPGTKLLLEMIERHEGRFRISFSVTGVLIEQLRAHAPKVIENLQALAETGCVEFLNETYHHSLAFLYSRGEFREQVDRHAELMEEMFGQKPTVFRNTELIYNNDLAEYLEGMGRFKGVLTEGADALLEGRSPDVTYRPPGCEGLTLLLRNYRLSDDIAFRFSNRSWPHWPMTAAKFADWVGELEGPVCNLFMDFETFGEHQWADTGIFAFLAEVPSALLRRAGNDFKTVGEAIDAYEPADTFDVPQMISWADTERDLSAWLGNAMQSNALHEIYKLEATIKQTGDAALLQSWRRLSISDHFYYMCTKYFSDGDVHKYFNPYQSPYDSYINFMNVLDNLRSRVLIPQK